MCVCVCVSACLRLSDHTIMFLAHRYLEARQVLMRAKNQKSAPHPPKQQQPPPPPNGRSSNNHGGGSSNNNNNNNNNWKARDRGRRNKSTKHGATPTRAGFELTRSKSNSAIVLPHHLEAPLAADCPEYEEETLY